MIVDHTLARLVGLPGTAPAPALHVYLPRNVEILVKSVAVPVRVTGLVSYAITPRTVRGRVDEGALTVTLPAPLLPVCSLDDPLLTGTGTAECARAFGVTVRSLDDCACDRLAVARPGGSHGSCYRSRDRSPLSSDRSRSGKRSWRPERSRQDREEAVVASRDRGNSGSTVEPAPAVAGGSIPLPTSSFPDLIRLFLSLSGSVAQRDTLIGSMLSAAGVTGAGVLPGPAAPVTFAAPVACSSASVPAPGVSTPAGAASATASPGRCENARESSRPERRRRRSSGRERSRSGGKLGRGRSPSPARSARSASVSASSSSASSDPEERVSAMPPPPLQTIWHRW